ncbi:type II toxin-antitoxin system RelE/ParE family toxin [Magnetovirga frankeli]|uniref:type II toxin-antitoxin system RelE/ParE family toxin n=1 Tax=Magnetovirga frankeli TaxID=947516 RepID=UPI001292E822|nr:type II toxin-antitoxin system RelE/ParE family toxin [gamma proteobacterium SS-5]
MASYQLRELARADLAAIWRYTAKHWGQRQADCYLRDLHHACVELADNPYLGRTRDEVKCGYRSLPQGRHVIFYLITASGVEIIGFPHQSEDVIGHFETDLP